MIHRILNVGIKHIGFEKKHQGLKRNCITFTHNSNINDVDYLMFIYFLNYMFRNRSISFGIKSVKNSYNYRKLLQILHSIKYDKFCVYRIITLKRLMVITNVVCNLISATSW